MSFWVVLELGPRKNDEVMDILQLNGKKFAIILIDYCEKKDGDWVVLRGQAKVEDGRLFVDRGTDTDFPIPDDTYNRIKEVTPKIASVVGDAEFYTMLTIGPMPDKDNPTNWPPPSPLLSHPCR